MTPDEPAVLYREHHDNAPEPAPQRDAEASDDDLLPYAIDEFTKAVVEKFSAVDRENQYLRGKLDALLTLLGKSDNLSNLKAADVVELPHAAVQAAS